MAPGPSPLSAEPTQARLHPADLPAYGLRGLPLLDLLPHPALHRARPDGPLGHPPPRRLQHVPVGTVSEHCRKIHEIIFFFVQ